ncbi:MAG: hypothetical protein JNK61_07420 [Bacteroidia bacterium]|nr:hypothetical protein [Bacteroidia bacterium]
MINKENYEAYFLDYHEGNLQPPDVAALFLFLADNPQLKKSFDAYEPLTVSALDGSDFPDKWRLKKTEITTENINTYLIDAVEGNLSDTDLKQLELFLAGNPIQQKNHQLFTKTKLQAQTVSYPNKAQLKHNVIEQTILNKWLIAQVEGDLTGHELNLLHEALAAQPNLRAQQHLYGKTKLEPTNEIYPHKAKLKRTVAWLGNNNLNQLLAIAAALILFVGYFVFTDIYQKQAQQQQVVASATKPNKTTQAIPADSSSLAAIDSATYSTTINTTTHKNITPTQTVVTKTNGPKQKIKPGLKMPGSIAPSPQPTVQNPMVASNTSQRQNENVLHNNGTNKTTIVYQPDLSTGSKNNTLAQSVSEVAANKIQQVTGAPVAATASSKKWQVIAWAFNRIGGKKVKMETDLDAADQVSNINITGSKFSIEHSRGF